VLRFFRVTATLLLVQRSIKAWTSCSLRPQNRPRLMSLNLAAHERTIAIEQVSSKARALDVFVFRGFQVSVAQFLKENEAEWTEEQAIDELMKGYDDKGDPVKWQESPDELPVHFVAISQQEGVDDTNGVVGIVRAQACNVKNIPLDKAIRPPASVSPFTTKCDPHIYLSNLCVDSRVRRQGIGSALLLKVMKYARDMSQDQIVLWVDCKLLGPIQLYQAHGFTVQEKMDGEYKMIKTLL